MKKIITILILCFAGILSAQSYRIGDLYTASDGTQGIVFYILPDNSGGWVVALNDITSGCAWGTNDDIPGLENLNPSAAQGLQVDTAGYSNTQIIRALQNNNTAYAAGKVDFNHGWMLPSSAQLTILFAQLPFITSAITAAGGTEITTGGYWSSTEFSNSQAWIMRFSDGYLQVASKSSSYSVRAVRCFSYGQMQPETLSYLWNTGATTSAITLSPVQTTTYTVTVSTSGGNSGSAQQTIVVGEPTSSEFTIASENPYTWNGVTYYQTGDYSVVLTTSLGCDSVVTLHLTMALDVEIVASDDTICEGDEVVLEAQSATVEQTVFVGDILCTDGSIVKPSDWPAQGKTAMGIVFFVNNTGSHGWATNLHESGTNLRWGVLNDDVANLTNYMTSRAALTDTNGYLNTQIIRNAGDASVYPAANYVDFDNGWYLPAAGQLKLLYAEMVFLNASLQKVNGEQFPINTYFNYASSSEQGPDYGWNINSNGGLYHFNKTSSYRVRSIRSF